MTKIISHIHLFGCIGLSIFGLICLSETLSRKDYQETLAFSALFATTASGIYLFVTQRNKLLVSIRNPKAILISYIHLLGCIGLSILVSWGLMTGSLNVGYHGDYIGRLMVFALFATTTSGIYLFLIRRQDLVQLWKSKKRILWAGTFVIVVMCLFPPWVFNGGQIAGHAYLFSDSNELHHAHIDLVRLIIQCAIVGLITGALLYTLNDKKQKGVNEAVR